MNQEQTIEFAKKTVADMISFFGENVDVEASVEGDVIHIDVADSNINSLLIGHAAETLRSLQLLVGMILQSQGATLTRVNLDVAGYKKQRDEQLAEKAKGWIEQVRTTGDSYVAHLNPADRRIVHQVATEYDDIRTFSEGEGRDRHLIIAQKSS